MSENKQRYVELYREEQINLIYGTQRHTDTENNDIHNEKVWLLQINHRKIRTLLKKAMVRSGMGIFRGN